MLPKSEFYDATDISIFAFRFMCATDVADDIVIDVDAISEVWFTVHLCSSFDDIYYSNILPKFL